MNKRQFIRGMDNIDPALIQDFIIQKEQLQLKKARRKANLLRVGALAACLCLMLTALFAIPLMTGRDTPPEPPVVTPSDTTSAPITSVIDTPPPPVDPNTPPATSFVQNNIQLSGTTQSTVGSMETNTSYDAYASSPGRFYAGIVIEAKVSEILPFVYSHPKSSYNIYVVELEILDTVRGEGLPNKIYYQYRGYDEHLFEGHDTFILSLTQIGIQNYVLINKTTNSVEFFPNMFETCGISDPTYGSIIAFTDGILDISFWKKTFVNTTPYEDYDDYYPNKGSVEYIGPNNYYPARVGYTVEQTKEKLYQSIQAAQDDKYTLYFKCNNVTPYYLTVDDIFISEQEKEFLEYVSPSAQSVFYYSLSSYIHPVTINGLQYANISMTYVRLINGFTATQETINVSGRILPVGSKRTIAMASDSQYITHTRFTEEELSRAPDIGKVIASLDLDALVPPHITPDDTAQLAGCEAKGTYKKVGDKIYGIVSVVWLYTFDNPNTYLMDDLYYLYDSDGNASIVERDELQAIIGHSSIIENFKYEPFSISFDI